MDNVNRLIDTFARKHTYLRISVTDRCNLRCTYCMPEHGIDWTPQDQLLRADEIIRLAKLFVQLGIRKIRITGGEPLVRKDIDAIVGAIGKIDGLQLLAMTTNGLKLAGMAESLAAQGLGTLTVSLDSLRRARFNAITKRDRFDDAMAGIEAALAAGFTPVKINIVVSRGVNDDEILDFIAWGKDRPVDLRFIEYMPFPDNDWSESGVMSYAEMRARIEEKHKMIPLDGDPSAVGKSFAVPGHAATVSFITSMTESFCGSCNRLRLTADGNIKSCLFHPAESSLRDIMRAGGDDDALTACILAAVAAKPAAHPPMDELLSIGNRSMISIGG